MALTGKQKRVLRGIGQLLDPIIHIGKEGVSDESIAATDNVFRRRELIKVRVLKTAPADTRAIAEELAEKTSSDVAGRVGFTFLLFRANPSLRDRIQLPPSITKESAGDG